MDQDKFEDYMSILSPSENTLKKYKKQLFNSSNPKEKLYRMTIGIESQNEEQIGASNFLSTKLECQ